MYFIYMLECSNNTIYTGYTTDMARRYQEHFLGSAKCKYTRSFPPKRLAACWKIDDNLSIILQLEHQIKRLSKKRKYELIQNPMQLNDLLTTKLAFEICELSFPA